ncbi:MAG: O-antigen ligase family protein [Candidatus Moraniibacteriota bacterium]|jgi:O-antigen ligase
MNILLNLTIFLYFFLPFSFALNPLTGFDVSFVRIFILIITLSYLTFCLYKKSLYIPKGFIISLFSAFILWTIFSLFFTPVPTWTLRKIIFLLSMSPLIFILPVLFKDVPNSKEKLLSATIIGATLISIVGLLQFILQFIIPLNTLLNFWLQLSPFFLGGTFSESVIAHNSWLVNIGGHTIMRSIAFFPDPHIFSFYLGLLIPLSLGLFLKTKKQIWLISFFILILTDLLTFSRGGYIGLFGGLLIGLILLWPSIQTRFKHFIFLFLISFIFLLLIPQNPITSRFISSFDTTDTSNRHRLELWTEAKQEIQHRPFIGTGLGAYPIVINPQATYRTPIYVHNIFLDITVELGIIGLILFSLTFLSLILILYKNKDDYISLFAIISIVIFFTHALFDTPIFSVHVFPILLLILSIGIYNENKK